MKNKRNKLIESECERLNKRLSKIEAVEIVVWSFTLIATMAFIIFFWLEALNVFSHSLVVDFIGDIIFLGLMLSMVLFLYKQRIENKIDRCRITKMTNRGDLMEIVKEGQERYLVEYTDEKTGDDCQKLFTDEKAALEFCAKLESFSFYKIKRCFVGEE